jgi:hypothetical protein
MKKFAEARATQGDFRFAWVSGTNHTSFFAYIRENGEEAVFSSDTNGQSEDFVQKLAELTGLPV